jgi:hypothetical protein
MKRQERPVQKAGIDLPKRAVYCFVTKARNRDKSMVSGDLEEEKQPFFTRLPSCWLRSPKFADFYGEIGRISRIYRRIFQVESPPRCRKFDITLLLEPTDLVASLT